MACLKYLCATLTCLILSAVQVSLGVRVRKSALSALLAKAKLLARTPVDTETNPADGLERWCPEAAVGQVAFEVVECGFALANGKWFRVESESPKYAFKRIAHGHEQWFEFIIEWIEDHKVWRLSVVDVMCVMFSRKRTLYESSGDSDSRCPIKEWRELADHSFPPPPRLVPNYRPNKKNEYEYYSRPHHGCALTQAAMKGVPLAHAASTMYFDMYGPCPAKQTVHDTTLKHASVRAANVHSAAYNLGSILAGCTSGAAWRIAPLNPVPGVRVVFGNTRTFKDLMIEFWPANKKNVFVEEGHGFAGKEIPPETALYANGTGELGSADGADLNFQDYISEWSPSLLELVVPASQFASIKVIAQELNVPYERHDDGTSISSISVWVDQFVCITFQRDADPDPLDAVENPVAILGGSVHTLEPEVAAKRLQKVIGAADIESHDDGQWPACYSVVWKSDPYRQTHRISFLPPNIKLIQQPNGVPFVKMRDRNLNPALGSSNHFALQLPHRTPETLAEIFDQEGEGIVKYGEGAEVHTSEGIKFNFFFVELAEDVFFDIVPGHIAPFADKDALHVNRGPTHQKRISERPLRAALERRHHTWRK